MHKTDFLVIGSGAAGLATALGLARLASVAVVTKERLMDSATLWAQGGIAAVMAAADSFAAHVADTLDAGAGLCHPEVVRYVVEHGPAAAKELLGWGVPFTRDPEGDAYHLAREGGHSARRILHAVDATGWAIETTLAEQARANPNIRIFEEYLAVDLIRSDRLGYGPARCLGAHVFNRETGRVETFGARAVVLATGGAGKVYLYTSNPDVATGDGIAMAYRAGCEVANMEFIQFHPTCLYHPKAKSFLITEAMRGEGAKLRLLSGETFMERYDPRGELAPRDIVARAIDAEMKRRGDDHVLLDISHKPAGFIKDHFPTIYARCLDLGIDITREPIPVVPAAHYTCGGIVVDLRGRTTLPGLYAAGECTCTGLHGANRLASNSLLECIVYAAAICEDISSRQEEIMARPIPDLPSWDESRVTDSDEEVVVAHDWDELRRLMWDYVGIVRSDKRLERARRRVELLKAEVEDYYRHFRVNNDLIELRNLVLVAEMVVHCALARRESRGIHYSLDHPERLATPADTVMRRDWEGPRLRPVPAPS